MLAAVSGKPRERMQCHGSGASVRVPAGSPKGRRMFGSVQTILPSPLLDTRYQQGWCLMVDIGPEARNARLAALMERAEKVFERSRRLVNEARKTRSEAEAKCRPKLVQYKTDDVEKTSINFGKNTSCSAE
jgi:hypothetical protein